MKSAKEHIRSISEAGFNHKPDCVCDRCKNGAEVFLLEEDIKFIQDEILACIDKKCDDCPHNNEIEMESLKFRIRELELENETQYRELFDYREREQGRR